MGQRDGNGLHAVAVPCRVRHIAAQLMTSIPSPHAPRHADDRAGSAGRGVGLARPAILLVVALLMGATVAALGPLRVAEGVSAAFHAYVEAQSKMLGAASNLTADGRSEFAVMLRDGATADDLRVALMSLDGVRFERAADLSGWAIVTTSPGNRGGLDALLDLPQTRLVVPNRGFWICH